MRKPRLLASGAMALATLAAVPGEAQSVPNPFGLLPDTVGPVDDRAPETLAYDARLPDETPEAVRAIDLASPVSSLEDALLRAYWFNPQLLAERANMRARDYTLPQARAQYGPSVSYSIGVDWQRDRIDTPIGTNITRSGQTTTLAAILNQPLYTFGRLAANERAARGQIAFQRAILQDSEQQVLFNAIAAYVGLLRDRAALQIAEDDLAILQQEMDDVRARFNVRESTAPDLAQVQTRFALSRANLATARAALAASEARFEAVIGSPAGELGPPPPLGQLVPAVEEAQLLAERQNPLLTAARAREQVSRAIADGTFAERLPRVDLQGRAELSPQSPYDNSLRQRSLQGGIVISGPIFDNGLLSARQSEAEATNDADWRLIDGAMRDLRAEVASAWSARTATRAAIGPLGDAVDAAEAAYEGATIQQRAGFRTTLDVLILARDLLNVRNSYNALVADAYLADARLLAAMGELDAQRLLPEGTAYDPTRHLERVDGNGEFLLWTPVLDALDGLGYPAPNAPRAVRDPALAPLPAAISETTD